MRMMCQERNQRWSGESPFSSRLALLSSSSPAQRAPMRMINPVMAIYPRFFQRNPQASPWRMVAARARERTFRDIFPSFASSSMP